MNCSHSRDHVQPCRCSTSLNSLRARLRLAPLPVLHFHLQRNSVSACLSVSIICALLLHLRDALTGFDQHDRRRLVRAASTPSAALRVRRTQHHCAGQCCKGLTREAVVAEQQHDQVVGSGAVHRQRATQLIAGQIQHLQGGHVGQSCMDTHRASCRSLSDCICTLSMPCSAVPGAVGGECSGKQCGALSL